MRGGTGRERGRDRASLDLEWVVAFGWWIRGDREGSRGRRWALGDWVDGDNEEETRGGAAGSKEDGGA